MILFNSVQLVLLFLVQVKITFSFTSHELYGGVCFASNNQLVLYNPLNSNASDSNIYTLDLNETITLDEKEQAQWVGRPAPANITQLFPLRINHPKFGVIPIQFINGDLESIDQFYRIYPTSNSTLDREDKDSYGVSRYQSMIRDGGVGIAFHYSSSIYVIDKLNEPNSIEQPIASLLKYSKNKWVRVKTTGDPPLNQGGFSGAYRGHKLFLTSNDNEPDSLYTLDLIHMAWTKLTVPRFRGANNGCLYVDESAGYLIHSFGLVMNSGKQPTSTTQIVDLRERARLKSLNLVTQAKEPMEYYITLPVLLGIVAACILFLVLALFLFKWLRFYKRFNEMQEEQRLYQLRKMKGSNIL